MITNLAGHKLPSAYPSRRVWIHLTVRDGAGSVIFESGRFNPDGSIEGNDNDVDSSRFEQHYEEISNPGQVQIYEPILADPDGAVTTVLLSAITYTKDNRLLPQGFDKTTAEKAVAVNGRAVNDSNFGIMFDTCHAHMVAAIGARQPGENRLAVTNVKAGED